MEASISAALFTSPRPLSPGTVSEVALPLADYAHLRDLLLLPVVHVECSTLARHLPLVFARNDSSISLCAMLGLRAGRTILSAPHGSRAAALPLLLSAFPLGLGGKDDAGRMRLVAEQPPGSPLSALVPAFAPDGSLAPVLQDKADRLWVYAAAQNATESMLAALDAASALAPWRLRLVFDDGETEVGDLLTIAPGFLESPRYLELVAQYGSELVELVEHHYLSKSRIAQLAELAGATAPAQGGQR